MDRRVIEVAQTILGNLFLVISICGTGYGQAGSAGSGQQVAPALTTGGAEAAAPNRRPARPASPDPDPAPASTTVVNGEASLTPSNADTQTAGKVRRPTELQQALEEFRIQIGKLSDGKKGSTVVGGRQNSLTGRLYEYLRNDLMDAVPHQVRQFGGNKNLLRRNQYGATVSGPVRLPWLYDGRGRTFFSFSFEGTRERISQSTLLTLPTNKQREGDFSDLVDNAGSPIVLYDPATTRPNPAFDPRQPVSAENLQYLRDPFPGNKVPLSRMDPVARALVALLKA